MVGGECHLNGKWCKKVSLDIGPQEDEIYGPKPNDKTYEKTCVSICIVINLIVTNYTCGR